MRMKSRCDWRWLRLIGMEVESKEKRLFGGSCRLAKTTTKQNPSVANPGLLSEIAFPEKAARSQKGSFVFSLDTIYLSGPCLP
jgi:hypothetical protein